MKPGKSGSGAKKKKPYYLNEVMQFTLPFVKLSNVSVSGNLPMHRDLDQMFNTEDSNEEDSTLSFGQETLPFTGSQSILDNYSSQALPAPMPSPSPQSPSPSLPNPSPASQPESTPTPLSPL